MPEANLLFIHALTGVHPGGGTALGVVDLPVQRERHTQWPMIPGSSLKGVLRDTCRLALGDDRRDLSACSIWSRDRPRGGLRRGAGVYRRPTARLSGALVARRVRLGHL